MTESANNMGSGSLLWQNQRCIAVLEETEYQSQKRYRVTLKWMGGSKTFKINESQFLAWSRFNNKWVSAIGEIEIDSEADYGKTLVKFVNVKGLELAK